MADLEAQMKSVLDSVEKLSEKNERLEDYVLKCQEEILFLRKTKRETDKKLDEAVKERAFDKQEMASIKQDVQDIQNDVMDIKKDVRRIESLINPDETKRLSKRIGGLDRKVNTLNEKVSNGTERLDITDKSVEQMKRLFNRLHESGQFKQDLGKEVDSIKHKVTQLDSSVIKQQQQHQQLQQDHRQLQQQQQQQLEQQAASISPCKPSVSTPMTQQEREDIKSKSRFRVDSPCNTQTRLYSGDNWINGYAGHRPESVYMDTMHGVYKTPIRGRYHFYGWMRQKKSGSCKLYLCEDGKGRRELLGTTSGHCSECYEEVCCECDEGVEVWLVVSKEEGEPQVYNSIFSGRLADELSVSGITLVTH